MRHHHHELVTLGDGRHVLTLFSLHLQEQPVSEKAIPRLSHTHGQQKTKIHALSPTTLQHLLSVIITGIVRQHFCVLTDIDM